MIMEEEIRECLDKKADWYVLFWILGILSTIFLGIFGYSWSNQNRIEAASIKRDDDSKLIIQTMASDISSIKSNVEWLDKLRKEGSVKIK